MSIYQNIFKKTAATLLFVLFIFGASPSLYAQQPADDFLMLTWRALNHAPPKYEGRLMPSTGTQILLSIARVNDGVFVDLSDQPVEWIVNRKDRIRDVGRTSIIVEAKRFQRSLTVDVLVPDQTGDSSKTGITIPFAIPEVVISGTQKDALIKPGVHRFQVLPYFFNNLQSLDDLRIVWSANNEIVEDSQNFFVYLVIPEELTGGRIKLSSLVENKTNINERASAELNFIVDFFE